MPELASFFPSGLTPALNLATMDRHLGWALTLTAVTLFMLQRAPRLVRLTLSTTVFASAIAPAGWSLSHWLGLAYQTPSLVTQGLALLYLLRVVLAQGAALPGQISTNNRWPLSALMVGTAMGWIMVLDTAALFPVSLYAFGYSEAIAIFGLILAAAFWMMSVRGSSADKGQRNHHLAIALLFAIAIYTFTRLPSGNAWDAMFDPWLWLVAQGALLVRIARLSVARFREGKGRRTPFADNPEGASTIKQQSPGSTTT